MRRRYWILLHLLIGLFLYSLGQYFWAVEASEVGRAVGLLGGVILGLLALWGLSFPIERHRKRKQTLRSKSNERDFAEKRHMRNAEKL